MQRFVFCLSQFAFVLALAVLPARAAMGQHLPESIEPRVRLSLRAPLAALVDSAVAIGLPSGPLLDKALEGISKGAADHQILVAVRSVSVDLGVARRTLGPRSPEELSAAAAAIRAGVTPPQLLTLAQRIGDRPLVVPLSVLSTLVLLGTPDSVASNAVVTYARDRSDAQMLAFGRDVVHNAANGMTPQAAIVQVLRDPSRTAAAAGGLGTKPKP